MAVRDALSGSLDADPSTPRRNLPLKSGTLKFNPDPPKDVPIAVNNAG